MDINSSQVLVDQDVAREVVGHYRKRTTDVAQSQKRISTDHFTSREWLGKEIALMRRVPLVVGHISQIPEAGDFFTRDILDTPVIVVRQSDGGVAIFRNMCTHRGGIVETEAKGNKDTFLCRYHGWAFGADGGGLKPVFYEPSFGKIDYGCQGLLRVKCDLFQGMILATLEPGDHPVPVEQWFGEDVKRQIEPWDFENSTIFMEKIVPIDANWKLVIDGAIDPLHPMFLHATPGGVGSRTINNTAVFKTYGRHGKMFAAREKLRTLIDSGSNDPITYRHIGSVMMLYPNSLYVNAPEHVEFWTVWPSMSDPGRCTAHIRFIVRPEILDADMKDRLHRSWKVLEHAGLVEDFPMEVEIQRNAAAWPEGAFLYGLNEKPAQHLHKQLEHDILG